jgi:hypothetical protein
MDENEMNNWIDEYLLDGCEWCSTTAGESFYNVVEPLKLTSADNLIATADDWIDTYLFIRGIK